jgi:hypothetical protein
MKTRLVLKAGDKGTRKVVREFGERLVCVRYRYDEVGRRRLKTAEIVVEEVPWDPGSKGRSRSEQGEVKQGAAGSASTPDGPTDGDEQRVTIQILYGEKDLRALVKEAGARWLPDDRLWELELGAVRRLGLEGRIVF